MAASNTLSGSRPGIGSVVVTTIPAAASLANHIVGVGVAGGATTVTPGPTGAQQYAVTVNTS